MIRKSIAIFTLGAFLLLTWSCISIKSTKTVPSSKVNWGDVGGPILAVQKSSGERVEFAKEGPGRFINDSVVGNIWTRQEFDKSQIQNTRTDPSGRVLGVTTRDGQSYDLKSAVVAGGKISGFCLDKASIPVSDVDLVWIRKTNAGATAAVNILVVAAVTAVVLGAIWGASWGSTDNTYVPPPGRESSCPFIYSYDGEDFHPDGEPYGGSICRALQRTEWSGLDHLQDVNGQYRLLLTNELEETEHTDELKLVVVDHPQNTRVVPDINGKIHTISRPLPPLQAYDQDGRDILPLVLKNDQVFWLTRTENKDPNEDSYLKDELIFEFPKPQDAKQVKLVANAWTTQWGSLMAKKFLEFYGRQLPDWYNSVNSFGRAFQKVMNWYATEELYLLQVRVETDTGWKTKGMIYGGGPFVAKDKAYVLDIADVPGETLRIRLTPASTFWLLDSLAVDYTTDLPLSPVELSPIKAVDKTGRDVRDELALRDGNYYIMPKNEDSAELTFLAPPQNPALARSVILKANGYYDVRLEASGEPQLDNIRRLWDEPGFAARYALRAFQRVQKAAKENLTSH
jgi:hypothetical protein